MSKAPITQGPVDVNVSQQGQYGMDECCIEMWGACCCNCRYHLRDNHHCTTAHELREQKGGCVCSEPKGWICAPPEFDGTAHSGWTEHGMCEMHGFKTANEPGHRPETAGGRHGSGGPTGSAAKETT